MDAQKMPWGWREAVYAGVSVVGLLSILFLLNPVSADYEDSFAWLMGLLVLVVGLPELTHYLLMRLFGARPRWRLKWTMGPALVSWWVAEGHRLSAGQYASLGLVPPLVTLAVGAGIIAATPVGALPGLYLLILSGLVQVKSVWLALIALRQPAGTHFEERADGTFIHEPNGANLNAGQPAV